jgi:predicted  nucleic acid-binding Zn-ribbon protein
MQTVKDYLTKVNQTRGGWYWLGTYGNIGTDALWNSKSRQTGLESWYRQHSAAKSKGMGKRVFDCIGIDKYARWVRPDGSVPYDSKTDWNTAGLLNRAKSKGMKMGAISTIPNVPGIMVDFPGHVGVYLGNGKVLEARGGAFGVVETNLKDRPWTSWYYNPELNYEEDKDMLQRGSKGTLVIEWQKFLVKQGYNLGNFGVNKDGCDGDFGNATEVATMSFLGKNTVEFADLLVLLHKPNNTAELDKFKVENTSLKTEVTTLKSTIARQVTDINTLIVKVSGLEQNISDTLNSTKQMILQRENEIVLLKNSNQILSGQRDRLNSDLETAKAQALVLQNSLSETNNTITTLSATNLVLENKINNLLKEIDEAKENCVSKGEEIEHKEEINFIISQQLTEALADKEELEMELNKLKEICDSVDIEALQNKIKELQERLNTEAKEMSISQIFSLLILKIKQKINEI